MALRADRGALAGVGTAAEAGVVLRPSNVDHPAVALGLALRHEAQVGDLRGGEPASDEPFGQPPRSGRSRCRCRANAASASFLGTGAACASGAAPVGA